MAGPVAGERSLEDTATWAVALVCAVFVIVSFILEHGLESLTKVRLFSLSESCVHFILIVFRF